MFPVSTTLSTIYGIRFLLRYFLLKTDFMDGIFAGRAKKIDEKNNGRQREFGFRTCRSTPPGAPEYSAESAGTFRRVAENRAGDAAVWAAHDMTCTGRIGARSSGQCGLFGIFQQIYIRCSRKFDKFATISLSPKTKESLLTLAWREIALLRTILLSRCPQSVHIISRIPVCCNLIYQNNFYPYPLPRRK